jgi:hypothetical protein
MFGVGCTGQQLDSPHLSVELDAEFEAQLLELFRRAW